jgi:DNA-binding transcriptional regulator of glucitol operon
VFRSLLTPRWLLLHVLFLAAAIASIFLAVWQWDRAHEAGGSFQNLGYALQWPVFGAFAVFLWVKLMRMELTDTDTQPQTDSAEPPATANDEQEQQEPEQAAEPAPRPKRKRPLVPPPAPPVDADEDPELAAYNAYLAELNKADQQHDRR